MAYIVQQWMNMDESTVRGGMFDAHPAQFLVPRRSSGVFHILNLCKRGRATMSVFASSIRSSTAVVEKKQMERDRALVLEIDAALEEDVGREACAWREAQEIRAYASTLLATRPNDERVSAWAEWAMQMADIMDPTQRRLRQIEMGSTPEEPSDSAGD